MLPGAGGRGNKWHHHHPDGAGDDHPAGRPGYDPIWFMETLSMMVATVPIIAPIIFKADVIFGTSPFVITMLLMIVILSIWPVIALWLPQMAAS
jgi:hypothetical protein